MVNPSLAYEVLMYINGFYFGLYATVEVGMGVLKFINLDFPKDLKRFQEEGSSAAEMTFQLIVKESLVLFALCLIETFRIHFGKKGTLSENAWQVWLSVILTVPVIAIVVYLLLFQTYTLTLEYILGGLMMALLLTELSFAFTFLFTICKTPTYD